MSFKLVHKSIGYKNYIKAKNSNGLCFGISSLWILELIEGRKSNLNPPSPYDDMPLRYHKAITLLYKNKVDENDVLENIGRQASLIKGVNYEIKSEESFFGVLDTNYRLKQSVNKMAVERNKNIFCLMVWRFPNGSGHAVVAFKNKSDGVLYFYDPNHGVYEWQGGASGFYQGVKQSMFGGYGPSFLSNGLFISTSGILMANRTHVAI